MADPKNDFDLGSDGEFDFNKLAEYETPTGAAQKEGSAGDDFAGFDNGGDADFPFTDDKADFGSSDSEPAFADDFAIGGDFPDQSADPFEFAEPPSPESVELASMSGNPDEEFGDFAGDDDFGGDDGSVDPFAEPESLGATGTVDPYAEDDEQPVQEEEQTATSAPVAGKSKLSLPQIGGLVAAVALVGYVGFAQVAPMFMSQEEVQIAANDTPLIEEGQLAPTLPVAQPSTLPPLDATPAVTDIAALPAAGEGAPQLSLPGIDIEPVAQPDQPAAPLGGAVDVPSAAVPSAPVETAAAPVVDPIEDFVGGSDRGGITSMKDTPAGVEVAAPVETASPAVIEQFTKRLDDVVKRIEMIERRVADMAATVPAVTTASPVPEQVVDSASVVAANPAVSAPLKPPIIKTAVLRGVSRDVAWIATGKDVVEVRVGDTIPDGGTVESFQNYRGRWIAVTDKGIILPK